MASINAYIPKPRFIVGVVLSLALVTLALKAGSGNATVAKVKSYLGLTV